MEDREYIDPNKLALNFPNQVTPGEKAEINLDGKNFEINVAEILSVLENTTKKYFDSIDYSFISSSKSLLSHFYYNEKECISKIKSYPYYKRKFYKSIIYDSILEIFKQGPEKLVKEVFEGLEKAKVGFDKKVKNYEEIKLEDFYQLLENELGTREVPKFLIRDDLKFIKFKTNYKNIEKKHPEVEELIKYYKQIKDGTMKPFDNIYNKGVLFDIFVLSNAKDIADNESINNIFLDNYKEILSWFNLNLEKKNYEYIFDNLINISSLEKKGLLESFFIPINNEFNNPENKVDLSLILIASFFYCVLHKITDYRQNNINNLNIDINITNSKITKFLSNLSDNLITYLKNCKYNINVLFGELFTYALSHINNNGKETTKGNTNVPKPANNIDMDKKSLAASFYKEENIDYDFKMIEDKIMESNDNDLKEKFQRIKTKFKIEPIDLPSTILGTLMKKLVNVFTSNIYYYANYIRLSPLQKYSSSNIVTIFVSGFGSENDVHCIEWKKYIENDSKSSTYYFYHWPGDSFTKIVLKSLPIGLKGIRFDSALPQVFIESKEKAKVSGKFLSLILRSRLFFGYRQINLVAFSLGNHVLKNCLKDLSIEDDGKLIINDVTFMAGATTFRNKSKYYKIFKKVIGGRIVNCYSKSDNILKYLYSNCIGNLPIGISNIDINDGKGGKNIVENYDFTDLDMGHLDYRERFKDILKRINN